MLEGEGRTLVQGIGEYVPLNFKLGLTKVIAFSIGKTSAAPNVH